MKRSVKTLCVFISAVLSLQMCMIAPVSELNATVRAASVSIDENNFPDEIFRNYVYSNFDQNKDHKLSSSDINSVLEISVDNMGISSLRGVEHFTKLTSLSCKGNHITSLFLQYNVDLQVLDCSNNELSSIDILGCDNLETLICNDNKLTSLSIRDSKRINILECYNNSLTELSLGNNALLSVAVLHGNRQYNWNEYGADYYEYDDYISLIIDPTVTIQDVVDVDGIVIDQISFPDDRFRAYVSGICDTNVNGILDNGEIQNTSFIDVTETGGITSLEGIQFFTSLRSLWCYNNRLTSLDVSNCTRLVSLDCHKNQLTSLDVSKCTGLVNLDCHNNQLTSLDVSNCTALQELCCYSNQLTTLDISDSNQIVTAYRSGERIIDRPDSLPSNAAYYRYSSFSIHSEFTVDRTVQIITTNIHSPSLTPTPDPNTRIIIDYNNFPDESFRDVVKTFDLDKDGYLSGFEISVVKKIDATNKNIYYLNGIEFFTELMRLDCSGGHFVTIDLSQNTKLEYLNCNSNSSLTELKIAGSSSLKTLYLSNSPMTILDLTGCSNLETLSISGCALSEIDLTGCNSLTDCHCSNNYQLTKLNLSDCSELQKLDIRSTSISEVNICDCAQLLYLVNASIRKGDGNSYRHELTENGVSLNLYYDLDTDLITIPDVVSGLMIESTTDSSVNATWIALDEVSAYEVNCLAPDNSEVTADTSDTSCEISQLVPGTEYTFMVRAYNEKLGGERLYSEFSERVFATTLNTSGGHDTPTVSPTVSPAPSVYPSVSPTVSVLPTDTPASTPKPTSSVATNTPTATPTTRPSSSIAPSSAPSKVPTVTGRPTATPTNKPTATMIPTQAVTTTPVNKPTSTPAQSSDESGISGFVERLYTVALGRPSDPYGKADWVNRVRSEGYTGADLARGFLFSDEFLGKSMSNSEFLDVLYETFFNRPADEHKADWLGLMDSGWTKTQVIDGFINSTEWANLCLTFGVASGSTFKPNITVEPSQGVIDFATRLYTTCLGREPDPAGLADWSSQLANMQISGSDAAHGFFTSAEFVNAGHSDAEYVTRLYRTFMGREPDEGGFNNWMVALASGQSREFVFQGFAGSAEWAGICADYGILR